MHRQGYDEYVYDGPVMEFDICVKPRWVVTTYAPSESKARSNLAYRYKREHNKAQNASIKLPGKLRRRNS